MQYLIASYPKSGNHYVRYLVEWLTKNPTHGTGDLAWMHKFDKPIFVRLHNEGHYIGGSYRPENAIAVKRHNINQIILDEKIKKLKMILIVRNYKEVMVRFAGGFRRKPPKLSDKQTRHLSWYAGLIELFEYLIQPKLLLYYEDLITTPSRSIRILSDFLGNDTVNDPTGLIKNHKYHKQQSLVACGDQITKGNATIYHSKILTKTWKKLLDGYLSDRHAYIYGKYLMRYHTL